MYTSKIFISTIFIVSILWGCIPQRQMNVAIPAQFKASAQKIHYEGLRNEWRKRPLHFGEYSTSKIKRGWKITYSKYDRNNQASSLERVLKAFNIDRANFTETEKDRFHFTIKDKDNIVDVFTKEERVSEITKIGKISNRLGQIDDQKSFQYSFSGAIIPQSITNKNPWKLFLSSQYEKRNDRKLFEIPNIPEEGIITNDIDTIKIKMIRINQFVNDKNQAYQIPFGVASIYEMRIDNEVCAILDTWGKNIWLYNDLDKHLKLVIAASSTAILLRRINESIGGY